MQRTALWWEGGNRGKIIIYIRNNNSLVIHALCVMSQSRRGSRVNSFTVYYLSHIMSTDLTLSGGICQRLHAGDSNDESIWSTKPTLQFLSIKKVVPGANPGPNNPNATTDRYRIIISDGLNFLQAMLATQLNYLVEEDRIGKNTIALVENMSCQTITDKRSVSRLSPCVSEIS
jgi:Replication factor-A protein 1, N-terminal domain